MTLNQYEMASIATRRYPTIPADDWNDGMTKTIGWVYPALALCGEAGEVAEKLKKAWRDKGGELAEKTVWPSPMNWAMHFGTLLRLRERLVCLLS